MIDPAEQLRRLAEGRAEVVGAYTPSEHEAEVISLAPRRWPTAVAAALFAIVAMGAGAFALFGGSDQMSVDEFVADLPSSAIDTTSTILGEVVVPDVVGRAAAEAAERLQEEGLEPSFEVLFVLPNDPRLGNVTEMNPPPDLLVPNGKEVELVIGWLAASTVSQNRCDRPPYLTGDFDGDSVADGVFPRWHEGRIVEIEVCTAAGVSAFAHDLDLYSLDLVEDLDLDGLADLIVSVDAERTQARVLSLVDGRLVPVPGTLDFGPRPDGRTAWWGCTSFSFSGAERLAWGTWSTLPDGAIEWRATELFITEGEFVTAATESGTVDAADAAFGPPGRARCETVADPESACSRDISVVMVGDVDGDGGDDFIAPRDDVICLSNGTVALIGDPAREAGTWFLDDIDDDGRLEVFIGSTTVDSMTVRPWSVDAAGVFTPAVEEDCCVAQVPATAVADGAGSRWFSCVAARDGRRAELVSGRFWVDAEAGTVTWTIDIGSLADPELTYTRHVGDPTATDAWIPGNGCRGSATPTVALEFGDDQRATADSIAAFNSWLVTDADVDRRFVRLREALGIADAIAEANGPYREDVGKQFIEVHGVPDDSTFALRWDFSFSEDGTELHDVHRTWACQPERGHEEFSTEPCL